MRLFYYSLMQYNKSLKGQAPSCQCLLQGKEVLMGDKSDHMIAANDEISFLKESNPTGQKPLPEKRSPTLNLKPLFFLVGGQMGSSDIEKHYSWKLNGSSIPQPPTHRYWRWERLLFAVWSRCGWTKWGEDVQLEEPIDQLPRAVRLDKYHLLLSSQRKISHIPGTC